MNVCNARAYILSSFYRMHRWADAVWLQPSEPVLFHLYPHAFTITSKTRCGWHWEDWPLTPLHHRPESFQLCCNCPPNWMCMSIYFCWHLILFLFFKVLSSASQAQRLRRWSHAQQTRRTAGRRKDLRRTSSQNGAFRRGCPKRMLWRYIYIYIYKIYCYCPNPWPPCSFAREDLNDDVSNHGVKRCRNARSKVICSASALFIIITDGYHDNTW